MSNHKPSLDEVLKSDPFYENGTANLDLSGFPEYQAPPKSDPDFSDGRFAKPYDDGRNDLRSFVEHADPRVLEEVAERMRNPELVDEVLESRAEKIATDFVQKHPEYNATEANVGAILAWLLQQKLGITTEMEADDATMALVRAGHFTVANLEDAFNALNEAGRLAVKPGAKRNLTAAELSSAAQRAATGDIVGAAAQYIALRVHGAARSIRTAAGLAAFTAEPRNRPVVLEALLFAWENGRVDYRPTNERRAFIQQYVGERFPTVALLDAAWAACQKSERSVSSLRLPVDDPTPEGIDDLSNAAIDDLLTATRREVARGRRR